MAEGEGFEPSIRYNRIPDFESGAFDHSAILPLDGGILSELFKVGMLTKFLRPICVTPTNPIAAKKFFLRNLLDFSTKKLIDALLCSYLFYIFSGRQTKIVFVLTSEKFRILESNLI